MIEIAKVKDFGKTKLNAQDVMIKAVLVERLVQNIILPENIGEDDRKALEKWEVRIINIGDEVRNFAIGDYIELKAPVKFIKFDNKKEDSDRIAVLHMNMIEFSITLDDYEPTEKKILSKE